MQKVIDTIKQLNATFVDRILLFTIFYTATTTRTHTSINYAENS